VKILLYSANFAPEPTGIGKYSGEMAQWLTAQGHEVRVVAAPPYYPNWQVAPGHRAWAYSTDTIGKVNVWRAPIWVPRKPGGLKRVLHLLSFAMSSAPVMLWQVMWRPDVVVSVAPAFVCAPTARVVAGLSGARSWLHVQDFEVDVAFNMGLLKGRWLQRIVLAWEKHVLRTFDVVSSISFRMVERLGEKGVEPAKLSHFPNWVDVSKIQPLRRLSHYRRELGIPNDARVVLYSGTLSEKHGLSILPECARLLAEREDIWIVICGDGVLKSALQQATQGMPRVRMIPLQPIERLSDLLGLADVHVLPQTAEAEDLVLPSKITGMLSSGRPVIATCEPRSELAAVVRQCGRTTLPGDAQALAAAIVDLLDDPELCQELGRRARAYAEAHLSIDGVLTRFLHQAGRATMHQCPESVLQGENSHPTHLRRVERDVANCEK
jgi:colanic acid biosynthesis glycosyl transferase WcaI